MTYIDHDPRLSHMTGLDDARPAANAALATIGARYYATDTRITYVCISSTAWGVLVGGCAEADKATWGTTAVRANNYGWSNVLAGTVGAAPQFTTGYTMVLGFWPIANPTAAEYLLDARLGTALDHSYLAQVGADAGDRGRVSIYMYPGGVGSQVVLTSATFTGALDRLHILAATIPAAGGSPFAVRYSWDGGAPATSAAFAAGALAPRAAGDLLSFGMSYNGIVPSVSTRDCLFQTYLGEATDAQLQALSGAAAIASARPALVVPGLTCGFAHRGAWAARGCIEIATPVGAVKLGRGRSTYPLPGLTKFAF